MRTEAAILLGWLVVDVLVIGWLWVQVKKGEQPLFTDKQIQLDADWEEYTDRIARKGFVNRPPLPDDNDAEPFHLDDPPRSAA